MKLEKKITDHNHDKCITTPEFNKVTAKIFDLRLTQANLASKSDIVNLVKNKVNNNNKVNDNKVKNLNKKITSNKTKHVLVEKELKKLQTSDSSLFVGQSYF